MTVRKKVIVPQVKKKRRARASVAALIKREESRLARLKQKKKLEDLRNEVKAMKENL